VTSNGCGTFSSLALDTASVCNLACQFCFTGVNRRNGGDSLSLEESKQAIGFAHEHGVRELVIAGAGEPLMDECFWPAVDYANAQNMQVVLYTNGTLIDDALAQKIAAQIHRVLVKRNCMDHGAQDSVTGVPGSSLRMLAGLQALMSAGLRAPRLCAESYILRSLTKSLEEVLRYCRRNGLAPYFESLYTPNGDAPESLEDEALSNHELTQFFLRLATIDRCEFGIDTPLYVGARTYGEKPCPRLRTTFSVGCDGEVRLCVDPTKRLGNIRQEALSDILSQERVETGRGQNGFCCSFPTAWCEPGTLPQRPDNRQMITRG